MRKPAFSICQNKGADQLRHLRDKGAADQRLYFRYKDTIPLLSISEISSLWPSSVVLQPYLHQTWPETPKAAMFRCDSFIFQAKYFPFILQANYYMKICEQF